MNNSADLQDRNLKIASKKLDILYFKKYQKKRCSFLCHDVNKKNVTNTRKIPNYSVMHLLYSAPIKKRKQFCTLLWKCQMWKYIYFSMSNECTFSNFEKWKYHLPFNVSVFVCLFEWAPEITNWYDNPQKWVVPWFGVRPQAQEQFYWSSSPPRCCWEVVWGGKGKTKRQEIDSCPKNPPLKWLVLCSTWPNNTHITGRYGYACPGHIHRGLW